MTDIEIKELQEKNELLEKKISELEKENDETEKYLEKQLAELKKELEESNKGWKEADKDVEDAADMIENLEKKLKKAQNTNSDKELIKENVRLKKELGKEGIPITNRNVVQVRDIIKIKNQLMKDAQKKREQPEEKKKSGFFSRNK